MGDNFTYEPLGGLIKAIVMLLVFFAVGAMLQSIGEINSIRDFAYETLALFAAAEAFSVRYKRNG